MAVQVAKQQLRQHIRKALASMTDQQRAEESGILVKKLLSTKEYQSSQRISVYINMPNEIQTQLIFKDIFSSGRVCFIPWCDFQSTRMEMLRVHSMDDINSLPSGLWDIKQPDSPDDRENALSTGGLDLIISPGLGFTMEGHRLGQGKGYYDTYLARCNSLGYSPKTIAMAYNCMQCDEIPMAEHDTPIDKILFVNN